VIQAAKVHSSLERQAQRASHQVPIILRTIHYHIAATQKLRQLRFPASARTARAPPAPEFLATSAALGRNPQRICATRAPARSCTTARPIIPRLVQNLHVPPNHRLRP
jgi:hypothetical protein